MARPGVYVNKTFTALTAPGTTASVNVAGFSEITAVAFVDELPAGSNVVLRLEGSVDGTNWFNLSTDLTVSSPVGDSVQGAFPIIKGTAAATDARCNFVSEGGLSTGADITFTIHAQ